MPWTNPTPVYVYAIVMIAVGVFFWFRPPLNKLAALLLWLNYVAANLIAFNVLNWSIVNYHLRWLCILLPLLDIIRYVYRSIYEKEIHYSPWLPGKKQVGWLIASILGGLALPFLVFGNVRVFSSYSYPEYSGKPVMMMVPTIGMYVVTNGGSSINGVGMNDYVNPLFPTNRSTDPSMAYAIDMQKLVISGTLSGQGSMPSDYLVYEGYNDEVRTPCEGDVVFVENRYPEQAVGAPTTDLGNRVVVKCYDYYVTVADLRSIYVKVGEHVPLQAFLGLAGNNGSPSIPHIHIHATLNSYGPDGIPVPIWMEDTFPTRNMIYIR